MGLNDIVKEKQKKVIAITANSHLYLRKFRSELATHLCEQGYEVIFVSPQDCKGKYSDDKIAHYKLSFKKSGYNLFSIIRSFFQLIRLIKNKRVNILINNTTKPFVFFSIIKYVPFIKVDVYSIVTGLGYIFYHDGFKISILKWFVRPLYCLSVSANTLLFFHNPDDVSLLRTKGFIGKSKSVCVTNGSGVDLKHFSPQPLDNYKVFVFIARLIKDKGIHEFLSAATIIKSKYSDSRFIVVGDYDDNPSAIGRGELDSYIENNIIEYLGYLDDVRDVLSSASCIVLPSYHEGCPRAVIEALAVGRAVITTDVPGCRETVVDGYNGYLVPKKSVEKLVDAIDKIILNPELVDKFSVNSRQYAEEKFNIEVVNNLISHHIS